WDGDLKFIVAPKSTVDFNLMIRIPGWARGEAIGSDLYSFENSDVQRVVIKLNGQPVQYEMQDGYAVIKKKWKKNDVVEVNLPMEVKRIKANEKLIDDIGKVALQRGPFIYCVESVDNGGRAANIIVPSNASFTTRYEPQLLNGLTVLQSDLPVIAIDDKGQSISTKISTVTAIPYYAWANRGKGEMMIWLPEQVKDVDIVTKGSEENSTSK
ncbi:MAG: glycoside hydrolase family 127 protein, partial [Flavisolibacter sp.]